MSITNFEKNIISNDNSQIFVRLPNFDVKEEIQRYKPYYVLSIEKIFN